MGKRKRSRRGELENDEPAKACGSSTRADSIVQHLVLEQYYPNVMSLRDYLICKLPKTSKARRKKLASAGTTKKGESKEKEDGTNLLGRLLDQTLIGIPKDTDSVDNGRMQILRTFSQRSTQKSSHDDSAQDLAAGLPSYCQNEVRQGF